jgi:exodeoxyribonuclease V alpha subunit
VDETPARSRVVRRTQTFRQAQESGIVVHAHRINSGEQPSLGDFGGFSLIPSPSR